MSPAPSTAPSIASTSHVLPPLRNNAPTFHLQLTTLVDSLMVWVGAGERGGEVGTRLGKEWAVGMPSRGNLPPTGTALFRTGASDIALPMAQRLARRLNRQTFLSLDLPPSLAPSAGAAGDPNGPLLLLELEKRMLELIRSLLEGGNGAVINGV